MAKKKKIKKHKAPPPVADINVTPMVDVMLVLLIIFMVITPMLSKGVSVDLVKTKNPIAMQAADKSDAVVCRGARATARPYLGTTQMPPEDLPPKVKDLLTNRLDKTVFVKADSRARYEKVVDVVDNLRAAGVDQLGLLTEQMQEQGQGGRRAAGGAVRAVIEKSLLKEQFLWQWQSADPGRSEIRHQHDAHDRRAAGADHHFHGDHAADAEGTGGAGAAAAAARPEAERSRISARW